jgi:hypothetical protein
MMPSPPIRWYALQVRPHYEKVVTRRLGDLKQEVFLPLAKMLKMQPGVLAEPERPLFPGYTFCCFDWDRGPKLYGISGFIRVVGNGKRPIPLDDKEVDSIRMVLQKATIVTPCAYVSPKDTEQTVLGSISGLARSAAMSQGGRVIISLPLLQRSICVHVEPTWITSHRATETSKP